MNLIADTIDSFYVSYFEQKAITFCEHSNVGKPHFFVNNYIESMSEINDALRSKLSPDGVSMILDMFDDEIEMNEGLPITIDGAFSIVAKYDSRNPTSLRAVRNNCRRVARAILMQMMRDSYVSIDPVAPLAANHIEIVGKSQGLRLGTVGDTFSGWSYTFQWQFPEHLFFQL